MNSDFVTNMKFCIKSTVETLEKEGITDFQARCEFLKYEIRTLLIEFSKLQDQNTKKYFFFLQKIAQKTRDLHKLH